MKNAQKEKKLKKERRHRRVRAKIKGTSVIPRFSVFRSSRHIYCQLINDENGKTLTSLSDKKIPKEKSGKKKKTDISFIVGELIAKEALDIKIKKVVFDRGGYKYHGRVKSVAEGAKKGGLIF